MSVRMLAAERADEAQDVWMQLERRLGSPALSCSWAWTGTWIACYGDIVPHRFAVGERDGRAEAIALVTDEPRGRLRPRTRHLGTAGEPRESTVFVERNRLLVADADRPAFAHALVDALLTERGWDRLRLDGLHPDDADALLAERPGVIANVEQSPVADLQSGGDVLDALAASRRQRVRRTLRAFGELETEWAETVAEGRAIFDELIDLHQARWAGAGEPGAFADPRFTAFHRALIGQLLPERREALVRVRHAGTTVGCLYGLIDGDRLLFYQSGLRRYDDNRLRAGIAAHVCFMRACRERGLARYDFLAPAERYKWELASDADALVWAELDRRSWRTRLSHARRQLRARR